jgi:LysM repeat protein
MSLRLPAVLILTLLLLAVLLPFATGRVLAGSLPQVVPTLNGTPPAAFTPGPFTPFPTNTPRVDGSIVHEVQPGEAMWSIAISYGTTIEEILALNGLPPGSTAVFVGQKLLIRMGTPGVQETLDAQATLGTPVASGSIEASSPQPTETRRPTSTLPPTSTPRPTRTPGPQASATAEPAARPDWLPDNRILGLILVGVGVIGLIVVLIAGFRR